MTQHWCSTCEEYRDNYVDDNGKLRGLECHHFLDAPENVFTGSGP